MKDLRFEGTIDGVTINICFRTDLVNSSSENFNVLQITTGPVFDPAEVVDEEQEAIFNNFKRLPNNLSTFIDFAVEQNVNLTISDSNGSNEESLVVEGSDSGSIV